MGTEIATIGPNPFEQYGLAAGGKTIEGDLLKFSKFGEWLAGKDGVKVETGTRLVAQMSSLQVGWIRWDEGRPIEHRMGYVSDGHVPVRRAELDAQDITTWPVGTDGKPRDPWQFTNSLVLVNADNEAIYTFQPSSRGGIGAMGELCRTYGQHMRSHPDELPVIALDVSSYRHRLKELGEIRVPVLRVVDWVRGEATAAAIAKRDDGMDDPIPF